MTTVSEFGTEKDHVFYIGDPGSVAKELKETRDWREQETQTSSAAA